MVRVQALSSSILWDVPGMNLDFSTAPRAWTLPNVVTVRTLEFAAVLVMVSCDEVVGVRGEQSGGEGWV